MEETYGSFWIEYRDAYKGSWNRYGQNFRPDDGCNVQGTTYSWSVDLEFDNLEHAVDAAVAWQKKRPNATLRIVNDEDGKVYWEHGHFVDSSTAPTTAGGTALQYEEKKPLHIPTDKLISRLEERATEERERREDAEKKVAERRQKLTDAIKAFTDDELTNLLSQSVTCDVKWFEEAKESKRYVSKDSTPAPIETTLEKQIRVLKMASDKEIEVSPTEEIYNLL